MPEPWQDFDEYEQKYIDGIEEIVGEKLTMFQKVALIEHRRASKDGKAFKLKRSYLGRPRRF